MSLIAKSKIAEYINKNPEARVTLLTWLKEYPYQEGKKLFSDRDGKPAAGYGSGGSQPGASNYMINYSINCAVKSVLITWVGSKEEHKLKMDQEYKERKEKDPNYTQHIIKVVDIVIKSPGLKEIRKQAKNKITETSSNTDFLIEDLSSKRINIDRDRDLGQRQALKTEADYQNALSRVMVIFSSQPGSDDFHELLALLPLIKNYEESELRFPPLDVYEIIKAKMDMVSLPLDYLAAIVGSEEKVNMFLAGKLELSAKKLERIYKRLHINLPVTN